MRSVRLQPGAFEDSELRSVRLQPDPLSCGVDDGAGDYLNCPLTRDEYERFYDALVAAESATVHDFDKEKFFEGCLPIEVMAHRGRDTLRFGPMKPVGLTDPRTGREPYAAVQLRQDNLAGDHFSLVGFQTQIKWGDQARVLRLIPGLEQAEFVRFGMVHRNTYVNGPTVLAETWQVRSRPTLFFAGQMSGVEGYVESAASGLLAGINAAALATGEAVTSAPRTTAIGALAYYVSHANPAHYEPSNITFGIMPALEQRMRSKKLRNQALSERALADLEAWTTMTGHLKAFLQFLALNRNVSAHTVRAYDSDLSQFLAHVAVGGRSQAGGAGTGTARSRGDSRFSRRAAQGRAVARVGCAQARRGAHVPALSAARGTDRRRSRLAGPDAETRHPHAGAPVGGRDGRAARRPGRHAARTARSRDSRAVLCVGSASRASSSASISKT